MTPVASPAVGSMNGASWAPVLPPVASRAMSAVAEVVSFLMVASLVYVIGYYVGGFGISNWWVALGLFGVWNVAVWRTSQTPMGSYVDHYVTTSVGDAAPLWQVTLRQVVRFTLLFAIPFIILNNNVALMLAIGLVAGLVIGFAPQRRAPWDYVAGTRISQTVAGEGAKLLVPVTSVADLQVSKRRITEDNRARRAMFVAGLSSVVVSALIVWNIFSEAYGFVAASEFEWSLLRDIGWFPRRNRFDLSTLIVGTLWITGIAIAVAGPVGLGVAFYLSEYASVRVRGIVKPVVETLASIPSVVLGFFAISFISPDLLAGILGMEIGIFSLLAAGIAVGILTVPIVASIAEDAMRAVPIELREASYGLGSRKVTTALRVVFPAALSGISAAFIVGISRAIGETMVVFIAAGGSGGAVFESNPTEPGQTITAAMASLGAGTDSVAGSGIAFQSLYFLGALLFILTLLLNVVSDFIVRKFRQVY